MRRHPTPVDRTIPFTQRVSSTGANGPSGSRTRRRIALAAALTLSFASVAAAANTPRLRLNGATAADNSTVVHASIGSALSIDLRGTPNAKFAVLLALESNGAANGFFLKPSNGPSPLVPIHPVFDGIGTATIASLLGLPPSSFVGDVANPAFQLGPDGRFTSVERTPVEIALVDTSNPGVPLVLPLESPPGGPDVALFLQAVEIDPASGALNVGNGVRVIFDPLVFSGNLSLALAEATSASADFELGIRNSLVGIADPNLGVAGSPPPVIAPDFALSPQAIDIYRIDLAGIEPLNGASYWSVPTATDPDSPIGQQYMQRQASGIDVGTGTRPVRNNDNPQFPVIEVPGGRSLFHYRDLSAGTFRFGFGLHDAATGGFHDLTPPAFASFTVASLTAPSPFEHDVLVSPSGDRALVVVEAAGTTSRLFLLDLVPGSTFSNGFPVVEIALPIAISRIYDESLAILEATDGAILCLFAATTDANPFPSTIPNRLYAVAMQEGGIPTLLLPGSVPTGVAVTQVGRLPIVSQDRHVACVRAGTSGAFQYVFALRATSASAIQLVNCTGTLVVGHAVTQWGNVTNGDFDVAAITPDGEYLAFCVGAGAQTRPHVVKTDGSQAGSIAPVAKFISEGGLFDAADFPTCRALHLTNDGKFLVFALGIVIAGPLGDRHDVFVADLATGTIHNLTRTIAGGSYLGPWDVTGDVINNRPTIEIGGTFASDSGDWFYFFCERRGPAPGPDIFNLVAISMAPGAGGSPPSFELINVTGDEFVPTFGAPPQAITSPATTLGGTFVIDVNVGETRLRHFPPGHPLAGHAVFCGMLASASTKPAVLLTFDPENPTAATTLATVPIPGLGTVTRITDIVVDPGLPRVAFVADGDNGPIASPTAGTGQDLFVVDATGASPAVGVTNSGFAIAIAAGTTRFTPPGPSQPSGILYATGSVQPNPIFIDLGSAAPLASSPTDASLFFHRFAIGTVNPAATVPVLAPLPPGNRRGMFVWSVR